MFVFGHTFGLSRNHLHHLHTFGCFRSRQQRAAERVVSTTVDRMCRLHSMDGVIHPEVARVDAFDESAEPAESESSSCQEEIKYGSLLPK